MLGYVTIIKGFSKKAYKTSHPLHKPTGAPPGSYEPIAPSGTSWQAIIGSVDGPLSINGNFGDGWQVSNFSFTVNEQTSGWYGAAVTVEFYEEVYDSGTDTWSTEIRFAWAGAVESCESAGYGRTRINTTERTAYLRAITPPNTINSGDYPNARDAAMGQPIAIMAGEFNLAGGAVQAWNVGDGRYLVADHAIVAVTSIFVDAVEIPLSYWQTVTGEDGRAYVLYTPPSGVSGIPEEETDSIFCNVIASETTNPVTCLKEVLELTTGDDDLFEDAVSVASAAEMTTRGYVASINMAMGDEIGDVINEFCGNFDTFATMTSEGGVVFNMIDPTSVKTFSDALGNILDAEEREEPGLLANYARIEWGYDFPRNNFAFSDNFIQASSVTAYGRRDTAFDFYFTRDFDTVFDVTRRKIRQMQAMPTSLELRVTPSEAAAVTIGDVITVDTDYIITASATTYLIKSIAYDWNDDVVTLSCVKYFAVTDWIVRIFRNFDGGTVSMPGYNVVTDGDDFGFDVTAYTNHTVESVGLDGDQAYEWPATEPGEPQYMIRAVDADHTVLVMFQTTAYQIQASDDGFGTISPKGNVYVASGDDETFTYTPKSGRYFSHWIVDGVRTTTYPYVFNNVDSVHTIAAFSTSTRPSSLRVTTTKTGTGVITPVPNGLATIHIGQYQYGADIWRHFDRAADVTVNGVLFSQVNYIHIKPLTVDTTIAVDFTTPS